MPFDLSGLPVPANLGLFAAAAALTWFAGARLSLYADAIAERTGLGHAFVGALLLGGATSLPEIATSVTASVMGNSTMAVSNLMGGLAMQIAVLAVVDAWLVRGALTFEAPEPALMHSGVLLILVITLGLAGFSTDDVEILPGVGAWPIAITLAWIASMWFLHRFEGTSSWSPEDVPDEVYERGETVVAERAGLDEDVSKVRLAALFAFHAGLVLLAGSTVSVVADALVEQTGLGSGFVGATLVALATSLPEVSTVAGAVRVGAYSMAIANIFGTNTLEVALLLLADIADGAPLVVDTVGDSAVLLGSMGIGLTALYLWGMLERRDRTILRMGTDSALVLASYLAGLGLLYWTA